MKGLIRRIFKGKQRPLLVPVIMPLACIDAGWPGPIGRIGPTPFALVWAVVPEPNRFFYVTEEQAADWDAEGLDWRALAFRNLARISEGPARASGEKLDAAGRPFLLALLHDDAIGPSRLLLPHLFDDMGAGYRVAIPEQTCAVVYRADLSAEQAADVDGVIGGCFDHGTEPMSPDRFDPRDFWGPAAEAGFA